MVYPVGCSNKRRNCVFNISVDSPKESYERIRGTRNYDKVKKKANRDNIQINIACVLNKDNYHCVEDLLEEWKQTKIGGVNFDFYMPIGGIQDDLWLNWQERDAVVLGPPLSLQFKDL
jgi:MoaA/NifB/PqqE/SkfB family radical SAM enzyme